MIPTRPLKTIWDMPSPPAEEWLALGWFPMETCPDGPVMRPHILYGPMPMKLLRVSTPEHSALRIGPVDVWVAVSMTHSFPVEAFEQYWMPIPQQPRRREP